ncbi:MAG: hypothetical protein ACREMN_11995 [Gemmatimonadales bacterium]
MHVPGRWWRAAVLGAALGAAGTSAACDGGLAPEPVCARDLIGICGTLRIRGTIPDSTDDLVVVAYPTFPQTCEDLFTFQPPFPPSVPYTDSLVPYSLPLQPGSYEWVLAVWKKQGMLTFTVADTALLREAGHYRDPVDTMVPGVVTVPPGAAAGGVDFTVDFDAMHPVSDYFTCGTP